jgi:Flp pilus assembly protein TadG
MKLLTEVRAQAVALLRGRNRAAPPLGVQGGARYIPHRLRPLLCGGEQGNAIVELAFVVPVLMGLLTAMFAFGIVFNTQIMLTQAVGSAAQHLAGLRQGTTDPCADTLTAITLAAPNLKPASIGLSLSLNGTPESGHNCAGAQSDLIQTKPVTVSATYPCTLPIFRSPFASACQLTATVTEYEY